LWEQPSVGVDSQTSQNCNKPPHCSICRCFNCSFNRNTYYLIVGCTFIRSVVGAIHTAPAQYQRLGYWP
jgi:hypothetical protein